MNTSLRLAQILPLLLLAISVGMAVALAGNEALSLTQRLFFIALMAVTAIFMGLLTPATVVIPNAITWYVSLLLIAVWPVITHGLTPATGQMSWFGLMSQAYIVLVPLPVIIALTQPKDYDAWRHRFDGAYG